jgi:TonB family protein
VFAEVSSRTVFRLPSTDTSESVLAGRARILAVLMHNWVGVTLTCVVLSVGADVRAAQTPPVPDNPPWAQTSLGVNPKTRCPELRIADEGTIAVVVFRLPSSGTPTQIAIKSPSGSNVLDSAAISCVSRLRFAAATRLGDGEPIDSWQQIGFRWAEQGNAGETRAMTSQNPSSGASRASEPVAGAPALIAADGRQDDSGGHANSVTVRVCVDETGRLKQDPTIISSSGKASLDQAAVRIAASGSAYYRPGTSSNGPLVSGCAQLAIKFEMK